MAITLSIKKFNSREYAYIVDNYRDPSTKRPTSRTHESYGRLDKLLAADPDALKKREARVKALRADSKVYAGAAKEQLLKGVTVTPESAKRSTCLTCTPAVFYPVWEALGMAAYFKNCRHNHQVCFDSEKTVFFAALSHVIRPELNLFNPRLRDRYLTDYSDIESQHIAESLEKLAD